MDMHTLLYLKCITNRDLLSSTGNSAQCYVAARMGGEFGREWLHVYVWLNPFTVHLKLPFTNKMINKLALTSLIGYSSKQNKEFKQLSNKMYNRK